MKIIYIGHSGFAIELPNRCAVIIDYYTDEAHIADSIYLTPGLFMPHSNISGLKWS